MVSLYHNGIIALRQNRISPNSSHVLIYSTISKNYSMPKQYIHFHTDYARNTVLFSLEYKSSKVTQAKVKMSKAIPSKNDAKIIFGWCMYDWAGAAYITTVAVGLLPAYFASIVVGSGGITIRGITYSATTLWGFAVGGAALIIFLLAPVLGAIADFTGAKKRFLLLFAYAGSFFTILLIFLKSGGCLENPNPFL